MPYLWHIRSRWVWTVGPGLGQGRETFLQGDLDLTRPLKREPPSHHPDPWPAQSPGAPGSYWMGNGRVWLVSKHHHCQQELLGTSSFPVCNWGMIISVFTTSEGCWEDKWDSVWDSTLKSWLDENCMNPSYHYHVRACLFLMYLLRVTGAMHISCVHPLLQVQFPEMVRWTWFSFPNPPFTYIILFTEFYSY